MQFHAEHHFPSPVLSVMRAMVDSDLCTNLHVPDLANPRCSVNTVREAAHRYSSDTPSSATLTHSPEDSSARIT